ncbi:hypothetical protein NLJ89_g9118 [Agrocybe chaxingu]|uniref:Uncharacterized protein n=1 Tax=Agrocybe chaxingu TaxID=84603 RepID=A0A9W8K0K7_9AGAR|nr:hypothetical protein NLJ89_g9118 [Agrocybe chaxingu]
MMIVEDLSKASPPSSLATLPSSEETSTSGSSATTNTSPSPPPLLSTQELHRRVTGICFDARTGEDIAYLQPTLVDLPPWLFRVERDLKDAGIPQAQWSDAAILFLEGEVNMAMRQRRQARRDLGVEVWDWVGFCKALEEVLGDIGIRAVSLAEKYKYLLLSAGRPSFLRQLREDHPTATKVVGIGLVAAGGVALAPVVVVGGLNALGFTAAGVASGSIAAGLQSVFYGGATTGLFSLCQSIGATAAAPTLASAVSAAGTVVAGATILGSDSKGDEAEDGSEGDASNQPTTSDTPPPYQA